MNDELENDLRQLNTWAKLSFAGGGVYIFAAALIILMTLPVTLGLMDLDSSLAELIDTLYRLGLGAAPLGLDDARGLDRH